MGLLRRIAVFITLLSGINCSSPAPPRELVIVAKGMAFIVPPDSNRENPVIKFRAGERVRVVFKNESPGLLHNFQIPAWKVATDEIRSGQTAEVTFTVPAATGHPQYNCRPHAELMQGIIEVE
jgi:plastocyanin